jgi:hypothetical protein
MKQVCYRKCRAAAFASQNWVAGSFSQCHASILYRQ